MMGGCSCIASIQLTGHILSRDRVSVKTTNDNEIAFRRIGSVDSAYGKNCPLGAVENITQHRMDIVFGVEFFAAN
eukprot:scaffold13814_cov37-Cyclotella_meneghiniana.AAC.1